MKQHVDPLHKLNRRPLYTHTKVGYYNSDGIFIGNVRKYLLNKINGSNLLRYLKGKYGWNNETRSLIEWSALEEALRTQSSTRQTRLAQIMHDWQNVGTQKVKIDPTSDAKCPTQCGATEDPGHYLQCQHSLMKTERTKLQKDLLNQMNKMDTHPGIKTTITRLLNNECTKEDIPAITTADAEHIYNATQDQLLLGHNALEKGYISKHWTKAQQIWYNNNNKKKRCLQMWTKKLIVLLQTYTYNVWKVRNTFLHGTNKKEQRLLQIQQCHEKIEKLYNMERSHLTVEQCAIFDIPKSQRKHQGLEAMALWIATSTLILNTTMKSGQKTITQCIKESNNMVQEKVGRKGKKRD